MIIAFSSSFKIAPQLHFLADIADRMEQINQRDDDHDHSSNEENTSDDQQQLLFRYLAESLQKQQQQQESGPIDFSRTLNGIKKEHDDEDDDTGDEDENDDVYSVGIPLTHQR